MEHSRVSDLLRFPANFLHALDQALDAEKIFLRELLRQFTNEGSIAAAKIDLQGRASSEKLRNIETRDGQL